MKYLIIGLGNIGADYIGTRHNIGFEVVNYLASEKEMEFSLERHAAVAEVKHKGRTMVLIKPTTYMNLSGKALRYWMEKEKVPIDRVLIIVDDLNLDFGVVRLKSNGSPGGHNGLKHIEQVLGHRNYARLRVGIGNRYTKGGQVGFVLGKWNAKEMEDLPFIVDHCAKGIKTFLMGNVQRTMNQVNKNVLAPPKVKKPKPKPKNTEENKDDAQA